MRDRIGAVSRCAPELDRRAKIVRCCTAICHHDNGSAGETKFGRQAFMLLLIDLLSMRESVRAEASEASEESGGGRESRPELAPGRHQCAQSDRRFE